MISPLMEWVGLFPTTDDVIMISPLMERIGLFLR
jgi:hypothetical protein